MFYIEKLVFAYICQTQANTVNQTHTGILQFTTLKAMIYLPEKA
jgi:hypothetical protein